MQTHTFRRNRATTPSTASVSTDELISLLSDNHAREISTAIVDEAKTAQEIVEESDSSRTTVYRRLNRLKDAGLLITDTRYDANGHHRTTYQLRFDSLSIHIETGGLNCAVESATD